LQRLTSGSPSFHDYGKMPPAMVLDLGCGQGHWILHAANVWKTAEFFGLDIVDTTLPAFETVENVRLVRGDL
jgi:ubiquinone/menaquinone biosynthesis C-methylase UbiE